MSLDFQYCIDSCSIKKHANIHPLLFAEHSHYQTFQLHPLISTELSLLTMLFNYEFNTRMHYSFSYI